MIMPNDTRPQDLSGLARRYFTSQFTEHDRIFFTDGYVKATIIFGTSPDIASVRELTGSIYDAMDGLLHSFTRRCQREGKNIACMKGCLYCCHQCVLAMPHEVLFLADHMKKNMSGDEYRQAMRKTDEKDRITSGMKAQDFLYYKHPCSLLSDKGVCSVYPVRPMACRTYLSANVISCIREQRAPRDMKHFPELYGFPVRAGRMVNMGITVALSELKIHNTEWPFESALRTAMKTDNLLEKWLEGQDIFKTREMGADETEFIENFGRNNAG